MSNTVKIILVDNSVSTRKGLTAILQTDATNIVIDEADTAEDLFGKLNSNLPDIIILDLEMPGMGGEKALIKLNADYPQIKIIIYSMFFESWLIDDLMKKGANGFIPKGCDDEIILITVNAVKDNNSLDNKELSKSLISKLKEVTKKPFENKHNLTQRELEVLNLICMCKSNRDIASIMHVTERTVETHKTSIYKKTGTDNCSALIIYSIKEGLFRV